MVQTEYSIERCQYCGKRDRVSDPETGEIVCSHCGFVISEKNEETGPERSFFTETGQSASRTGMKTSLSEHDMGLSTVISYANKDATGKNLSSSMKSTMGRIRIWDSRSKNNTVDRNMKEAFTHLKKMKDKLGLSSAVSEKAAYIYRKALEKNLVRGRSIVDIIAASLYIACRDSDTPRTLKDFVEVANVKKKTLSTAYRKLVLELDLKMPVVDSVNCVARIASKTGLSESVKRVAFKIIKEAERQGISQGKNPMSIAATALYIATTKCKERFSQRDIAMASNVTEVTIRNRLKDLSELAKNI